MGFRLSEALEKVYGVGKVGEGDSLKQGFNDAIDDVIVEADPQTLTFDPGEYGDTHEKRIDVELWNTGGNEQAERADDPNCMHASGHDWFEINGGHSIDLTPAGGWDNGGDKDRLSNFKDYNTGSKDIFVVAEKFDEDVLDPEEPRRAKIIISADNISDYVIDVVQYHEDATGH